MTFLGNERTISHRQHYPWSQRYWGSVLIVCFYLEVGNFGRRSGKVDGAHQTFFFWYPRNSWAGIHLPLSHTRMLVAGIHPNNFQIDSRLKMSRMTRERDSRQKHTGIARGRGMDSERSSPFNTQHDEHSLDIVWELASNYLQITSSHEAKIHDERASTFFGL